MELAQEAELIEEVYEELEDSIEQEYAKTKQTTPQNYAICAWFNR